MVEKPTLLDRASERGPLGVTAAPLGMGGAGTPMSNADIGHTDIPDGYMPFKPPGSDEPALVVPPISMGALSGIVRQAGTAPQEYVNKGEFDIGKFWDEEPGAAPPSQPAPAPIAVSPQLAAIIAGANPLTQPAATIPGLNPTSIAAILAAANDGIGTSQPDPAPIQVPPEEVYAKGMLETARAPTGFEPQGVVTRNIVLDRPQAAQAAPAGKIGDLATAVARVNAIIEPAANVAAVPPAPVFIPPQDKRNGPGDGDNPAPVASTAAHAAAPKSHAAKPEIIPMAPETAKAIQAAMSAMGMDIGKTGPNKDGCDGVFGPKSIKAFKEVCEAAHIKMDPHQLTHLTMDAKQMVALGAYMSHKIDQKIQLDQAVAASKGDHSKEGDHYKLPPDARTAELRAARGVGRV